MSVKMKYNNSNEMRKEYMIMMMRMKMVRMMMS